MPALAPALKFAQEPVLQPCWCGEESACCTWECVIDGESIHRHELVACARSGSCPVEAEWAAANAKLARGEYVEVR